MPALLSVEKQSVGNDSLHMAVCYYFQMNGVLLLGYITYRNLSRLWNLLTASVDMIMLQVEPNGQKHPAGAQLPATPAGNRKVHGLHRERKDQLLTIHHWPSAQCAQEQALRRRGGPSAPLQ